MRQEWPLGKRAAEGAGNAASAPFAPSLARAAADQNAEELFLPLALHEHVELIMAGPAIAAIARKRAVQIVTHGHSPDDDLTKTPAFLAREAKARLNAFLEIMPVGRMNLPPQQRERCLRYIEIAAALLIALHDRCQVEVPE